MNRREVTAQVRRTLKAMRFDQPGAALARRIELQLQDAVSGSVVVVRECTQACISGSVICNREGDAFLEVSFKVDFS